MTRDQQELVFALVFAVWFLGVPVMFTVLHPVVALFWPIVMPIVIATEVIRNGLLKVLEFMVKIIWRGK